MILLKRKVRLLKLNNRYTIISQSTSRTNRCHWIVPMICQWVCHFISLDRLVGKRSKYQIKG